MKKKISFIIALLFLAVFVNAQRFGYVDTEYILENVPPYQKAQNELDEQSIEWQKEIEKKFEEIHKMYKKYQAEEVLLPEDMKQKRQSAIIEKEKEAKALQKQRFGSEGDLFKKRQELVKPVQDKVYKAIKEVAKANNLDVIFDTSTNLNILYTNAKYDKSDAVLRKMGYSVGSIKKDDE